MLRKKQEETRTKITFRKNWNQDRSASKQLLKKTGAVRTRKRNANLGGELGIRFG